VPTKLCITYLYSVYGENMMITTTTTTTVRRFLDPNISSCRCLSVSFPVVSSFGDCTHAYRSCDLYLKRYDLKNVKQVLRRPMTLLVTLYCLTIGLTYDRAEFYVERIPRIRTAGPPLQRGVVLQWFYSLTHRNTFVGGTECPSSFSMFLSCRPRLCCLPPRHLQANKLVYLINIVRTLFDNM